MNGMLFFRIGCDEALGISPFCQHREKISRLVFGIVECLALIGKRVGMDSAKFPRQALAEDFEWMIFQGDFVLTERCCGSCRGWGFL